ncbi:FecR family protein [Roseiterribacter gracilis]|uniref:Histidine kinase n=1 Tax=Roseiterribacter gracilis TaxID=2812848 RepID=A0A8S8X9P0_9PROT|nr:histidine kinase [Rhodospirillales bacterium TMPK1]
MWDKSIAEQAAAWADRIQSGQASVQEQAAFVAWLDESITHAEAYHQAIRQPTAAPEAAAKRALADAKRRRMRQYAMAASVVVVALVVGGIQLFDGEYSTAAGAKRTVELRDGSTIVMAGATRIREEFSDHERRIQLLEGQALFQVAHNPARPFRVEAGLQTVQAVGTAFDVSRAENRVEVAVSDGIVAVTTKGLAEAGAPAVLKLVKGQAVAFQGPITTGGVRSVPVERIGSWREGRVYFEKEPLARVLDAMGRQYGRRFTVDDPMEANRPISIVLKADSNQADVVKAVEGQMALKAVDRGDRTTSFTRISRTSLAQ